MSAQTQPANLCTLCKSNESKYVCPKCNALYCGLECYRSAAHAHCSEQFYKDCIQDEIGSLQPDSEQAKSMQEILTRLQTVAEEAPEGQSEDEDDLSEADSDDSVSDTEEDLAKRLAGVDLDDADQVWQLLSKEEKAEFQRLAASGDMSEIVPAWQPWWLYSAAPVQDIETVNDFKKDCPKIIDDIPALQDISKVNPAIGFGMSNVIMAYALVARHFQGDHRDPGMLHEAASSLMHMSTNLGKIQNFTDQETALASVRLQAAEVLGAPPEDVKLAEEDLEKIFAGPSVEDKFYFQLAAISDCIHLLKSAQSRGTKPPAKGEFTKRFNSGAPTDEKFTKKEYMLAVKKLEFYIAWIKKVVNP